MQLLNGSTFDDSNFLRSQRRASPSPGYITVTAFTNSWVAYNTAGFYNPQYAKDPFSWWCRVL